MKRHRRWLLSCHALAALAAAPVAAKVDDPNDLVRGRWYATEVIIFERTDSAGTQPEELVWERGRAWPAGVRAFVEPEPWRIGSLDPLTRACLEFPRLELRRQTLRPTPLSPLTGRSSGASVDSLDNALRPSTEVAPPTTAPAHGPEAQPSSGEVVESLPGADATPPGGSAPLEPMELVPPPPIDPRLSPHPLLRLLNTAALQQESLRRDSYRWLPAPTHALKTEARRLRRSPGLDIIWHGRWIQPVPDRSAGEPLMLDVQPALSRGRLSGTLQVTLGRYLHFNATLWLEQPPQTQADPISYMQLEQARTMRSGKLHYLDHPKMGILVRIDPLPPSPALVQALQAWERSAKGA